MESLSNESHQKDIKEGITSLETDLETLKAVNQEFYNSRQEELQTANKIWEKARTSLLEIENKKINVMKSIKSPPVGVMGVGYAVLYLMAGNVPEDCIRLNEEKELGDVSWEQCQIMLKDFDFLREKMLDLKRLIDEEKLSFEQTKPVREYLDSPWFHVPSLKLKSIPASQLAEAVIHIIHYFDIVSEIRLKIKVAIGKSGAEEENKIYELQERED